MQKESSPQEAVAISNAINSTSEYKTSNQRLAEDEKTYLERCSMYQFMSGVDDKGAAVDPLARREKFAVNLRKEKHNKIIMSRRKKTLEAISKLRPASTTT